MYWVEGNVIHRVYKSLIFVIRNGITSMAFERVVVPETLSDLGLKHEVELSTVYPSPQYTLMQL